MDERTDQELVKACLEGSRSAFSQLVERHQDSVFGLAVSMTRNREDAADMAQDAFHALVLTIRFKETLFPYYFCAARW